LYGKVYKIILEDIRPNSTIINAWVQRSMHAMTIVWSWSRFVFSVQLHFLLESKRLCAVFIFFANLLKKVLSLPYFMCATRSSASVTSWPGTGAETATETMLTMSTLIVVGKVFSSMHTSALNLTLVSSHHIFIPTHKSIVPVTFFIDLDVITISIRLGCGCSLFSSSGCL